MGAIISKCGKYRYTLSRSTRQQAHELSEFNYPGTMLWVMLNPSTADAELDDPTIRRCRYFTAAYGFETMVVVNLFGLRATNPLELLDDEVDPIGPQNDQYVGSAAARATNVVLGWGDNKALRHFPGRVQEILRVLKAAGHAELYCLKQTKSGAPGHPLYLPNASKLTVWDH